MVLKKLVIIVELLVVLISFSFSADDYSHRKRDCVITIKSEDGPVANINVKITQIRNHFGFGASINRWSFDTLGEEYGKKFLEFFDYATPENEMKWTYVDGDSVKKEKPDYERADWLVDWCLKHGIKVRGHNLFWNEHTGWIPKWTYTLTPTEFKAAMKERIESAMGHFKGRVVHWDVINEIVHGRGGSTPTVTMLDSATGDPNIFKWILEEARKIDPISKFVINDYNLIEQYDVIDKFVAKVKPLAPYYDIVGCEGHFGRYVERSSYEQKINKLASQLNKPIWLTEVDFSIGDTSNVGTLQADKMEELMRACFANKNVEGFIIWVWCKRKMWRPDITSYLVDSLLNETEAGKRWKKVRNEWKTNLTTKTDAQGKIKFNGFQGEYEIKYTINNIEHTDTFYLEPGNGAKEISIIPLGINHVPTYLRDYKTLKLHIKHKVKYIPIPISKESIRYYLTIYSLQGKVISKIPISQKENSITLRNVPSGTFYIRIESDRGENLVTRKIVGL